ncbi:MAG: OsmC family protein [Gammaproteobacteria bacterium]
MAEYFADISWELGEGEDFPGNKYSRGHKWKFDGGYEMPASSSPHVVPVPFSVESFVDPEEAFVASLSSCHMLWFLALAAKDGFIARRYDDKAKGVMARNAEGRLAMTEVVLSPVVAFDAGAKPTARQLERLHHEAHEKCFIANSVKTAIRIEPG